MKIKKLIEMLSAVAIIGSFTGCDISDFKDKISGGDVGIAAPIEENNIGNIYNSGQLQYIGQHKDDFLYDFNNVSHYGDFEGADLYNANGGAFWFDYETGLCTGTSGDFIDVIPGFRNVSDSDVVSRSEFEKQMGISTTLCTGYETELQTSCLTAYHGKYYYVIGCDDYGNISFYDICEVYLKNDATRSYQKEKTGEKYECLYVYNCTDCVNLRTAPNLKSKVITTAKYGETVTYISDAGNGFYKVMYNGKEGYMSSDYLTPNKPEPKPQSPQPPSVTINVPVNPAPPVAPPVAPTPSPSEDKSQMSSIDEARSMLGSSLRALNEKYPDMIESHFEDKIMFYKLPDGNFYYGVKSLPPYTTESVCVSAKIFLVHAFPSLAPYAGQQITQAKFENVTGYTNISYLNLTYGYGFLINDGISDIVIETNEYGYIDLSSGYCRIAADL